MWSDQPACGSSGLPSRAGDRPPFRGFRLQCEVKAVDDLWLASVERSLDSELGKHEVLSFSLGLKALIDSPAPVRSRRRSGVSGHLPSRGTLPNVDRIAGSPDSPVPQHRNEAPARSWRPLAVGAAPRICSAVEDAGNRPRRPRGASGETQRFALPHLVQSLRAEGVDVPEVRILSRSDTLRKQRRQRWTWHTSWHPSGTHPVPTRHSCVPGATASARQGG